MAVPADLDRIIKNLELENEQLVKLIEQEKEQCEALEKDITIDKERTCNLLESNSQLDEDIKRYHKQFTHLRDNCESLKKTATILSEHEEALVRKLDQVATESERERMEQEVILNQYKEQWADYQSTYDNFPLAKQLRSKLEEMNEAEQMKYAAEERVGQLQMKIQELQDQRESTPRPFETLEEFIVKLAEIKISVMRSDGEINKMMEEKKETKKKIAEVKEQLRLMEEERLMNIAMLEQERANADLLEQQNGLTQPQSMPNQHCPMDQGDSPAVLHLDTMMLQGKHEASDSSLQTPVPQQRSPPQSLQSAGERVGLPNMTKPQVEVPLLQQLHVSTLQQKFASSRQSNVLGSMQNRPLPSTPKIPLTLQISMPQLMTPRLPTTPRIRTAPIPPPSPQINLTRPQVMLPPPSPQVVMPKLPQTYTPRVVTTPRIQVPQRPRPTLPLDMIGNPGKGKDFPQNVDVSQPPPARPAEFPRVSLPMDMIGKSPSPTSEPQGPGSHGVSTTMDNNIPRASMPPMSNIQMPKTPGRVPTSSQKVAPTSFSSGYVSTGLSPENGQANFSKTPDRPLMASSTTPITPGNRGTPLCPEDSPFDLEKHLRRLQDLKSKSPGFSFQSRPMCSRADEKEMEQSEDPPRGQGSFFSSSSFFSMGQESSGIGNTASNIPGQNIPSGSASATTNAFNFGFNENTNTEQAAFNFSAEQSPKINTGFNFGGGDANENSNDFSFGGFGGSGGGDNAKGNIFSMFGESKATDPKSPRSGFSFAGFGGGSESPQYGGGMNLF